MTTESPTPSSGPDQKIEDIPIDIEDTRKEVRAATVASSANTDVTGRAKQKVAEGQGRHPRKDDPDHGRPRRERPYRAIHRARQPYLARGLGQPTVIAIATAAVVVVGVVKWLRGR